MRVVAPLFLLLFREKNWKKMGLLFICSSPPSLRDKTHGLFSTHAAFMR